MVKILFDTSWISPLSLLFLVAGVIGTTHLVSSTAARKGERPGARHFVLAMGVSALAGVLTYSTFAVAG